MPLDIDIQDGANALDNNQLQDALDGTYWVSGWEATLGTGDLEVDIAAGTGAVGEIAVETTSTETVDFTGDVDPDNPRKAVISFDDTGTIQKTLGNPEQTRPVNQVREKTYTPSPPASVPGVAVAEIWLGAGATSLVSGDIRDRRVSNDSAGSIGGFSVGFPQDELANRTDSTVYQNTTGSPLRVSVVLQGDETGDLDRLSLFGRVGENNSTDNPVIDWSAIADTTEEIDDYSRVGVSFIVPDGGYYSVGTSIIGTGGAELSYWTEQQLGV